MRVLRVAPIACHPNAPTTLTTLMRNGSDPSAQNAIGLASRCAFIASRSRQPRATSSRQQATASFPRFLFEAWIGPEALKPTRRVRLTSVVGHRAATLPLWRSNKPNSSKPAMKPPMCAIQAIGSPSPPIPIVPVTTSMTTQSATSGHRPRRDPL